MVVAIAILAIGIVVMLPNSLKNNNSTPTNSSSNQATTAQATYIPLSDSIVKNLVNSSSEDIVITNPVLGDQNSLIFSRFPEKQDKQSITVSMMQYGGTQMKNGYILTNKKESSQIVIQIVDISDGKVLDIARIPVVEPDDSISSLQFSGDGKKILISVYGENSDRITNQSDIQSRSRIYEIDLAKGTIQKLLDQVENLQEIDPVAIYGETAIFRHFGTETDSTGAFYTFDLTNKSKEKDIKEIAGARSWGISPSGKQIVFKISDDMEGRFMPNKLLIFDLTTQSFTDLKNLDQSSLQASDFGTWPNRTEFNSIAWTKDGKSLIMLKRVFSNSDIENAQITLLRYDISSGQVTTISAFNSKIFSAGNILGDIDNIVYVSGSINGNSQINAFPENKKIVQLNQGDSVSLIY